MKPTMIAAQVSTPGGPLELVEVPRPVPLEGQVLVRIAASALNPLDAKIREGKAAHARHPLPAVLGIDGAGTVEALGPGVDGLRVGDQVMGMIGGVGGMPGTLAQYVAVDARVLALQPSGWSALEASTLPLTFVTAWEGLVDRGRVGPRHRVLVFAGAGGVGSAAVQVALALGARVWATGRASQREVIEALGAEFLDWDAAPGALEAAGPFDLVYDTLGGTFLDQAFTLVRPFGQVVSCLGWGYHGLAPLSFKGGSYSGVFTLDPLLSGRDLEHLGSVLNHATQWANRGALRSRVGHQFRLETVNEAFVTLGAHGGQGRVVVDIS